MCADILSERVKSYAKNDKIGAFKITSYFWKIFTCHFSDSYFAPCLLLNAWEYDAGRNVELVVCDAAPGNVSRFMPSWDDKREKNALFQFILFVDSGKQVSDG